MATSNSYEFQCPQFVDFSSGVEGSPSNVTGFGTSPGFKDEEFKMPMPKRVLNVKSSVKKTPAINLAPSSNITDSVKLNAKKMQSKRFSKSDGALNVAPNVKQTFKKLDFPVRKRSLSENDLKVRKKIYPTTPMCLKRTINNVKSKKIKTSEEIELETIAQLRKEMFKHLRANEITMKRQKVKQTSNLRKETVLPLKAPEKLERNFPKKAAPVKSFGQNSSFLEKVNDYARKARSQAFNHGATKGTSNLQTETLKKSQVEKTSLCSSNRFLRDFIFPTAPNPISVATFEKESINAVMKNLAIKKTDAHSGLTFSAVKRKTAIKPFNFQDRTCDSVPKGEKYTKQKDQVCNVLQTPKLIGKNKENIPATKFPCSIVKSGRALPEKKTESRGFRY